VEPGHQRLHGRRIAHLKPSTDLPVGLEA
jgi:hypothetical protein